MSLNEPNTQEGESDQNTHCLIVIKGRQAGARAKIAPETVVSVGTDLGNDIALYSQGANKVQISVTGRKDSIEIVVVEGVVLKNGEPLTNGVVHEVDVSEQFAMANSVFAFEFASNSRKALSAGFEGRLVSSSENSEYADESSTNRRLTYLYIAGGLILLTSVVTTSFVRAFQSKDNRKQSFFQALSAAGYENLHVVPSLGNLPARVTGAVFSVEDRSRIQAIAADSETSVELDLQINEDLAGAVDDVYRVNGISAEVQVIGIGEVEVWTSTKNTELLTSVESSIKKDIPDVISLTTKNSIPVDVVVEVNPIASIDPDKQITLVVAGEGGYLMTRDKSRYFVGSVLPSGHVINKIEDGNVYVRAEDGKVLILEFE